MNRVRTWPCRRLVSLSSRGQRGAEQAVAVAGSVEIVTSLREELAAVRARRASETEEAEAASKLKVKQQSLVKYNNY